MMVRLYLQLDERWGSGQLEVVRLSIEPENNISCWIEIQEPDLSRPRLRSSSRAREEAKSLIRVLLAGPAAQRRYSFGSYFMEFNLLDRYLFSEEPAWRAIAIALSLIHI